MNDIKISVIGLGYVGLPVAIEFGKKFTCIGYDTNPKRIKQLKQANDITREINKDEIKKSKKLQFSNNINDIDKSDFFIITVPTPIFKSNKPDLSFISKATKEVAKFIKKGSIVIYESTVYPGLIEDFCGSMIERISNYSLNKDFYLGYSPERINPGDKKHKLTKIVKVTSGSNSFASNKVDRLYKTIIKAGTFKAESIQVAEAAKVIENTQRDLNIALMNELSIIFSKLGINTHSVLETAATKWNFQKFKPGLVGGHCIGVDPYYLTHKARSIGLNPRVILAGRKIKDQMASNVVKRVLSMMKGKKIRANKAKALILGYTFKENCSDIRNTKVEDMYNYLIKNGINTFIYDPLVKKEDFLTIKSIINKFPKYQKFDLLILAVRHTKFINFPLKKYKSILKKNSVVFDLQNIFPKDFIDGAL